MDKSLEINKHNYRRGNADSLIIPLLESLKPCLLYKEINTIIVETTQTASSFHRWNL